MLYKSYLSMAVTGGVLKWLAVVLTLLVFSPIQSIGEESNAPEIYFSDFEEASADYKIDPYLLYALALLESGRYFHGLSFPYPWSLNYRGRAYFYKSKEDAAKALKEFLALPGIVKPDVGFCQVSIRYHHKRVSSPYELLDPLTNLRVGASILREAIDSTPDFVLGVGRYHTWSDRKAAIRYGKKVLAYAGRIKTWHREKLRE